MNGYIWLEIIIKKQLISKTGMYDVRIEWKNRRK